MCQRPLFLSTTTKVTRPAPSFQVHVSRQRSSQSMIETSTVPAEPALTRGSYQERLMLSRPSGVSNLRTNAFPNFNKILAILFFALLICGASAPCFAQTKYYVDPNYTGSTRNGSAAQPWQSLNDSAANPWQTINTSL